jgi:anthranilate/para-aminobenzoate synthase component II
MVVKVTKPYTAVEEIRAMNPRGIMVSPGPGRPEDSGGALHVGIKLTHSP